jgi:hypothetical protein
LEDFVKKEDPDAELEPVPTVLFGDAYLAELPNHVAELGCNPDFNAYTLELNPVPDSNLPIRTGSGHIHVGFTENADVGDFSHLMLCAEYAKQLDFFLGLPSLYWDRDNRRRNLYGKAGAFRPKPYGLEYRVLSNKWLTDEELMEFVYDRTIEALDTYHDGEIYYNKYGEAAKETIDRNETYWKWKFPDLEHLAWESA